mgnify:CR=1 FL=1
MAIGEDPKEIEVRTRPASLRAELTLPRYLQPSCQLIPALRFAWLPFPSRYAERRGRALVEVGKEEEHHGQTGGISRV